MTLYEMFVFHIYLLNKSMYSKVPNKIIGHLILFQMFSFPPTYPYLFVQSPPVLLIKIHLSTLLFGIPVIFGTLEYKCCFSTSYSAFKFSKRNSAFHCRKTSHSVATSIELHGVKIDGSLYPNFIYRTRAIITRS